jgi:hypothetical protein
VVVTEGELQSGAYGVAAPVLDVPGLEASLGLVSMGPLPGSVGELVLAAVGAMAAALGTARAGI